MVGTRHEEFHIKQILVVIREGKFRWLGARHEEFHIKPILVVIREGKFRWLGHVMRSSTLNRYLSS